MHTLYGILFVDLYGNSTMSCVLWHTLQIILFVDLHVYIVTVHAMYDIHYMEFSF